MYFFPFVTLYAGITNFSALSGNLFLLSHTVAIFFAIRYPLKFKTFKDGEHMKFTYFVAMITIFMISGVIIAVQVSTGYTTIFYVFGCLPANTNIAYSTVIIPISLTMGISTSLLAVILWELVKVSVKHYLMSESKVCTRNLHVC